MGHAAIRGDAPAGAHDPAAGLGLRRLGLRLLATVIAGLWVGLGLVILVGYRPGGPWDMAVVLTAQLPAPVAAIAIVWPPLTRSWRRAAAITWLGFGAALLVAPLVGLVVTQLASGGSQTLLPSPEVAYAAVLAVAAACLFSMLGLVAGQDARGDPEGPGAALERRASVLRATALAGILTAVAAVLFGGAALFNELALREETPVPSRFGPVDPALANPECEDSMAIGAWATLEVTGSGQVDDETVGEVHLQGVRDGTDESWTGTSDGPSGEVDTGYARIGSQAWVRSHERPWVAVDPDPYGMLGLSGLTVDGPVAVAARRPDRPPVAEDLGLELIEGAKARHCRTAVDGPTAQRAFVPLRWLAGGDPIAILRPLAAWRGTLDWWVFADGQLGQAALTLNGYPGEAWPSSGLQGEIALTLTAVDRGFVHLVEPPPTAAGPGASPSGGAAPTPGASPSGEASPVAPGPGSQAP